MTRLKETNSLPNADCAIQVIGFGMAGLGLGLAADRQTCLKEICEKGLVYIDKRRSDQFDSLNFNILSNSPAADFITDMHEYSEFGAIFNNKNGKRLRCLWGQATPLTLASDFFKDAAIHFQQYLSYYPRSHFFSGTSVNKIHIEKDGSVTSYNNKGEYLKNSTFAVIATGSIEKKNYEISLMAKILKSYFNLSESILRCDHDQLLYNILKEGRKIVIVGGSHSAFSVVEYLLRVFGEILDKNQLIVLNRGNTKLYYENIDEFHKNSIKNERFLIDHESNSVNRYCGLRGSAKKIYESIIRKKENRVKIISIDKGSPLDLIEKQGGDVGMVVQATGYSEKTPEIVDHLGNSIEIKKEKNCISLSKDYNFCTSKGIPIKQIFGIGLGSFVSENPPFSTTGEVAVGVNIYHQKDAASIINRIRKNILIDAGKKINLHYTEDQMPASNLLDQNTKVSDVC
ncbi:MAG: hypothetical protein ACRBBR_00830 [Cellvibrionaceae bacterium]